MASVTVALARREQKRGEEIRREVDGTFLAVVSGEYVYVYVQEFPLKSKGYMYYMHKDYLPPFHPPTTCTTYNYCDEFAVLIKVVLSQKF